MSIWQSQFKIFVFIFSLLFLSLFPGVVQEHCAGSPAGSVTSRFVEEETQRSQELLLQLDFHIHNMRQENAKTVCKYIAKDRSHRNPLWLISHTDTQTESAFYYSAILFSISGVKVKIIVGKYDCCPQKITWLETDWDRILTNGG